MAVKVKTAVTQEQAKEADTRSLIMKTAEPLQAASKEERQQRAKAVFQAMASPDGKIEAKTLTAANLFYMHAIGDFDMPEEELLPLMTQQLEMLGGEPEKLAETIGPDLNEGGQRSCSMVVGLEMALGITPIPW
mmetsp:Transcript_89727/g.159482  ORF Transcript_89727/g.159482 Transcript_89727/m.159482 type:complete len:134 (+) Transcript_89727:55-456(+)|eukprot:CAMPEP_0197631104 /NCGR_PEP_ID=MMETSP1338-20131121/8382_1 /TAXON_ID=43686 ORGANISM="Pelagodinium beii, Strain RCC1491" /NCGR_SAMPLE_ID=MMETSP1338 /ASSEMBLY_ACC=CAM_ASM_000754 /LENGTH=133 /DNA_ID=CAMNT_0043202493 /DNA_START=50 /DNA_END=451 /DNA_ORIENTATION=-